jgi:hypothetical protein
MFIADRSLLLICTLVDHIVLLQAIIIISVNPYTITLMRVYATQLACIYPFTVMIR